MSTKENALLEQGADYKNNLRANSSPINALLQHLDGLRSAGPNRWMAKCPAHEDRSPSLSIREMDDGRILVHCFAGCSVHEIVSAVGLELTNLFPPRDSQHFKSERRPFPAADILRAIAFEALVVAVAGSAMLAGEPFNAVDRDRLFMAVSRIHAALNAGGLRHG